MLDHTKILNNHNEDQISDKVIKVLKKAVEIRKTSDVPVGVFYLAGLTPAATQLSLQQEKEKVKTFTIGYDDNYSSYQNETEFAKYMAKKIGAEYYEKNYQLKI